jgi:hypothetical protein
VIAWLLRAASRELRATVEPVPEGVYVRAAKWLPAIAGRLSGMRGPAAAVTLGRTIIVHPNVRLTSRLVRHELAHVRQWQRHPISFPVRYAMNHLRYGYHANPYEVEARAAELPGGNV